MALQIRRGTNAERLSITPKEGEPIFAVDTNEFFIGDGTTQGGILVSGTLVNETSPALGTDLDLNGNNIIGTGNINIAGTITATGNINLGDGADDNVIVGGQIASALTPDADITYDLGGTSSRWNEGFIKTVRSDLVVANSVEANTVGTHIGTVQADDSSLVIDGATGTIYAGTAPIAQSGGFVEVGAAGGVLANLKVLANTADNAIIANGTTGASAFEFPTVVLQAHRGTAASPTAPAQSDVLGGYVFNAHTGADYVIAGSISARTEGAISPADVEVPTTIQIGKVSNLFTQNGGYLSITSDGYTSAPSFTVGSFATGAEPANPTAGQIIFDSTTNKFKGWDGSAWVDFH
jgi:hypothetical protein